MLIIPFSKDSIGELKSFKRILWVWVYWFWCNSVLSLVQRSCISNWRICFSVGWWNLGWKGLKASLTLRQEQLCSACSQEGNLLLKVPHHGCAAGVFWQYLILLFYYDFIQYLITFVKIKPHCEGLVLSSQFGMTVLILFRCFHSL